VGGGEPQSFRGAAECGAIFLGYFVPRNVRESVDDAVVHQAADAHRDWLS
jgi:hypothetical protein